MGVIDFRAAAGTGSGVSTGRFQRKTTLDDRGDRAIVQQAIRRAKAGDDEALRFLYVRYADNVYGYVRTLVHDDHEAADVTQRVFAKLMVSVDKYEDRGKAFMSWLMRFAHNVAIDHVRSRSAIASDFVGEEAAGEDDSAAERSLSVRHALHALPDDQRNVVVLRHFIGLSPREIAEKLGRTESSVHGLHHRGRRALQKELLQMGCGPTTNLGGDPPPLHAA
jgi:RNA polymerase sigma-70 factor (ECF subfamily)